MQLNKFQSFLTKRYFYFIDYHFKNSTPTQHSVPRSVINCGSPSQSPSSNMYLFLSLLTLQFTTGKEKANRRDAIHICLSFIAPFNASWCSERTNTIIIIFLAFSSSFIYRSNSSPQPHGLFKFNTCSKHLGSTQRWPRGIQQAAILLMEDFQAIHLAQRYKFARSYTYMTPTPHP